MSFSYAVLSKNADGWHVTVNDFVTSHEAVAKTLPEIIQHTKRMIEHADKPKEA